MSRYIHVRMKEVLQIGNGFVILLDPRSSDRRVRRSDGKRIGIPRDFLQGRTVTEGDGDGGDGAAEGRREEFGGRSGGVVVEDVDQ
eukprot:1374744-Ditylum_brightwellii.AAC.1